MPYGFNAAVLIMPILSTFLLKIFYPRLSLKIAKDDGNYHIYSLFNYIFVFFIAFFIAIALYIAIDYVVDNYLIHFNPLQSDLPDIVILAIRNFMVEVLWFFGIHGSHTINGLFGKEILFKYIFENLTYGEFNRLFVLLGGAGIGLALLVSLFLYSKDKSIRTIVNISIPFSIFNINTLLIYAIVVFNRYLLLPFLLLPLANLIIAYIVLNIFTVDFTNYYVVWTTPTFIDSYLKTNGDLFVVYLQAYLLFFDVLVYRYFVKKYLKSKSVHEHEKILEQNLNIQVDLNSEKNIESYKAKTDIIEANIQVEDIISKLNEKNLFIYYQPKIDIQNNRCDKFEALIRYKKDGKLTGPDFLETLESAGLAHIIDVWVCTKVNQDLKKWKKEYFFPKISVNLHPDTLKYDEVIEQIISILKDKDIEFEIIERSLLHENAKNNLLKIEKNEFELSIDDYGTGYSSLETIAKYNANELKLDKSLIDIIETKKGYQICKHTSDLCHELNYSVVAEGVETKEQYDRVKNIGINRVQGYYLCKALPFHKIIPFKTDYDNNIKNSIDHKE
jgi:EAL domain-containing protein (putative c-di-GMP-specific phosphodiesterase class I)